MDPTHDQLWFVLDRYIGDGAADRLELLHDAMNYVLAVLRHFWWRYL